MQARLPAYGLGGSRGYGRRRDVVEKLMRFDPEKANVHQFLAAYLFSETAELSPALHPQLLAKALLAAAKAHNDGVAEELVALLGRSYELIELDLCHGEPRGQARAALAMADARFREHLRALYWDLPDSRRIQSYHVGTGHPLEAERCPTLVKTKLVTLDHIIGDWVPQPTKESVGTFRFMVAAHSPGPVGNDVREGESHAEWKAQGRFVSETEQDGTLRLIREHVGASPFTAEAIESWLEQPMVPEEIQKVLAMARARHGGPELAKRDIRNARVLKLFKPDERSPDALRLLEALGGSAAHLDTETSKLPTMMQPDSDRTGAEQIGGSKYVLGKITVWHDNLTSVRVSVRLPPECSEELGRDVFGRARRHLDNWLLTHGWFAARLWVIGGRGNLDLGYPADPAQYAGGPFHPTAEQPRA